MGNDHTTITSTGRLSQDEAMSLLANFKLYRSDSIKFHRRSSSKTFSTISVFDFLLRFPSVMQPFVAAVLPELRLGKKTKTKGKLTAECLVEIGMIVTTTIEIPTMVEIATGIEIPTMVEIATMTEIATSSIISSCISSPYLGRQVSHSSCFF